MARRKFISLPWHFRHAWLLDVTYAGQQHLSVPVGAQRNRVGRKAGLLMTIVLARLTVIVTLCMPAFAASGSETRLERGQHLFLTGDSGGSAARAIVGPGNVSVRASSIPCASCHGRDG